MRVGRRGETDADDPPARDGELLVDGSATVTRVTGWPVLTCPLEPDFQPLWTFQRD
jgi:hypothetical protein